MDKGIKGLTVTFESFDQIVLKELQETVVHLLDPTNDPYEKPENTLDTVDGFMRVVDWYSTPSEYKTFKESIQSDYDKLVSKIPTVFKAYYEIYDVPGWSYYND